MRDSQVLHPMLHPRSRNPSPSTSHTLYTPALGRRVYHRCRNEKFSGISRHVLLRTSDGGQVHVVGPLTPQQSRAHLDIVKACELLLTGLLENSKCYLVVHVLPTPPKSPFTGGIHIGESWQRMWWLVSAQETAWQCPRDGQMSRCFHSGVLIFPLSSSFASFPTANEKMRGAGA